MNRELLKATAVTISLVMTAAISAGAQETGGEKRKKTMPIVPVIIEYDYAPQYFSQVIDDHAQYSKIEATVGDGEKPGVEIALTEKESGKRVFYANSESSVKTLLAERKEVYPATIDFKSNQSVDQLPTYGFGFLDKHKQPVLWRVIPASRPSERGRELIPASWAEGLRLEYRDLATAVGAGTAVQIGDKVIEARPWKEISSPPYFVAYRGTVAIGRHLGTLLPGTKKWSLSKQPARLEKGAEWTAIDENAEKTIFRVASDRNGELVIEEAGDRGALLRLVLHLTPQGTYLRNVEIKSRQHGMRIRFEPELPLEPDDGRQFKGRFAIDQGEHKDIARGAVYAENSGGKMRLRWQVETPSWARSRSLESVIVIEPSGYSIETTQIGK